MTDANKYWNDKRGAEQEEYEYEEIAEDNMLLETRIEELEAQVAKAVVVIADLYRLHLRRGPAWDHPPTSEVMDEANKLIAELNGEE